MLLLPINFIKFWYIDSITFFLRTWKHILIFLEEDLAVGLMFRLLFTPLFHDSSVFGRVLSFIFRSGRIVMGVTAYFVATIVLFSLALLWFLAIPLLFISFFIIKSDLLLVISGLFTLFGLALFIQELIHKPLLRVWHIKDLKDIWKSTKLKDQI